MKQYTTLKTLKYPAKLMEEKGYIDTNDFIQGKLIEENSYSNSVVSACFNLWERRNEFRKNNPNTKFESHLNPAKGLKL